LRNNSAYQIRKWFVIIAVIFIRKLQKKYFWIQRSMYKLSSQTMLLYC